MTIDVNKNLRYAFKLGLLLTLLTVSSANAAPTWHEAKITEVYPLANGAFIISFDSDSTACTSSSVPKYYYVEVGQNGMTQEGLKNMLSVSLTAASLQVDVLISFDDSSAYCYVNRINAIFVR